MQATALAVALTAVFVAVAGAPAEASHPQCDPDHPDHESCDPPPLGHTDCSNPPAGG